MTTRILFTGSPRFARSPTTTALGRILDAHMARTNISQTRLAEALCCDPASLSRIRSGTRRLAGNYDLWASVLGVDVETIILAANGVDPDAYRERIANDAYDRVVQLVRGEVRT